MRGLSWARNAVLALELGGEDQAGQLRARIAQRDLVLEDARKLAGARHVPRLQAQRASAKGPRGVCHVPGLAHKAILEACSSVVNEASRKVIRRSTVEQQRGLPHLLEGLDFWWDLWPGAPHLDHGEPQGRVDDLARA
eukprot:4466253-Alexandrium_andersonii.AAC.1